MKTLFNLLASMLLIAAINHAFAQDCVPYYPIKEGTVREMASYDKKDKLTGTTIQTIKEIKTTGNKTEWTIGTFSKDSKGKELSSGDLHMTCESGIFKMDMRNFLDQETLEAYKDMQVTMDATDLEFPGDLSAGQTLPDGSITVKVSSQGMAMMTMVVKVYDRKVQGMEEITTPAGTFSCYKMSSTIETKSIISIVAKSTDWMAENVGSVRSESYDKNGNLTGYTVLTAVK